MGSVKVYTKNITKKLRKISQSILEILLANEESINISLETINSITTASNQNGISFHTVFFFAVIGYIIAVIHIIKRIFAILLHNIFHIAKSVFHSRAEITFTINSGADVQNATIVNQITIEEILNLRATDDAQSTRKSAHFIRNTNQTTNNKYTIILN